MCSQATCQFEQKVWGEVAHVFVSDRAAVSYLRVTKGTRSSRHFHQDRANQFIVLSGRLVVEEWRPGGDTLAISLVAWQSYSIPSGVLHRFRVLESGEVIEVYWPDRGGTVRLDDIERLDEGGEDE